MGCLNIPSSAIQVLVEVTRFSSYFRSAVPELVNYEETVENFFLVPSSLALYTQQCSWLRSCAISRKVAGSSPDEMDFIN
jgi:hypothetical protein